MAKQTYFAGTGRRKTAIAQVRLMPGNGTITVNGIPYEEIFSNAEFQRTILKPLISTESLGKYNVVAKVDTADGFRYILADTTWLLIRFSGTEPILRIYAESNSPERLARLLKLGRELVGV